MQIITDTASLFAPSEGDANGLIIIPVSVAINNRSYKDYAEISSHDFLKLIEMGGVPTSSQPAIGEVLDVFEACQEEMLVLTVGDGLSGAYQSAVAARNCAENKERIHVVNSKTLAGPLRYLAKKAVELKNRGLGIEMIKEALHERIESSVSFVVPEDFEFLKRSGRLTAITAKLGGVLKLLPVLTQTEDKTRIKPVAIKRTWKAAVETILQRMEQIGVNQNYLISVCHAGTAEKAELVLRQVQEAFPAAEKEILTLSPALITHGGPGCIVIQAIRK